MKENVHGLFQEVRNSQYKYVAPLLFFDDSLYCIDFDESDSMKYRINKRLALMDVLV